MKHEEGVSRIDVHEEAGEAQTVSVKVASSGLSSAAKRSAPGSQIDAAIPEYMGVLRVPEDRS